MFFSGMGVAPTLPQRDWSEDTGIRDVLNVRKKGWLDARLGHPGKSTGWQSWFWPFFAQNALLPRHHTLGLYPDDRKTHYRVKLLFTSDH